MLFNYPSFRRLLCQLDIAFDERDLGDHTAQAPVKEIMKDMMEMSRGVLHPIRGLSTGGFLTLTF
jgi:hypothetical protein